MQQVTYLYNKFVVQDGTSTPASANVDVYKLGASTSSTVTVTAHAEGFSIPVVNLGGLSIGDTLGLGSGTTSSLVVDDSIDSTHISVTNTSGSAIVVASGTRLIATNHRPLFYNSSDPLNATSLGSRIYTDATTGVAAGALNDIGPYDIIIAGTGVAARVETSQSPNTLRFNAAFFSSIQAAIDALPADGGEVYIPEGTWPITSSIVLPYGKNVRLIGAGVNHTKITASSSSLDMLIIKNGWSAVEELQLSGPGTSGAGRGIVIGDPSASPGRVLGNILIRRCLVADTASWGLYVVGSSGNILITSQFIECRFSGAMSNGAIYLGPTNTTLSFRDCSCGMGVVSSAYVAGYLLQAGSGTSSLILDGCVFEESLYSHPWVSFGDCVGIHFRTCWFEDSQGHPTALAWFLEFLGDTHAIQIDTTHFRRAQGTVCNAINFYGQTHSATVSACEFFSGGDTISTSSGDEDINIRATQSEAKPSEVMVIGGWRATNSASGPPRIADGSGGAAQLTGYKIRVPQMSGASDLVNIQTGDMYVDTTSSPPVLKIYLGSAWKTVTTS